MCVGMIVLCCFQFYPYFSPTRKIWLDHRPYFGFISPSFFPFAYLAVYYYLDFFQMKPSRHRLTYFPLDGHPREHFVPFSHTQRAFGYVLTISEKILLLFKKDKTIKRALT